MPRVDDNHYRCPTCGTVFECPKSEGCGYRDSGYCKKCDREYDRKWNRKRGVSEQGSPEHLQKISGKNNPNYIDGRSQDPLYHLKWNRKRSVSEWGSEEHIQKISGENSSSWKGGKSILVDSAGNKRVEVYIGNGKYQYRSRLIMKETLGRELKPEEVVHHIDGDMLNDNPDNLQLFSNQSEHLRFHHKQKAKLEEV